MGVFIRKSKKLGPLRVNLSKSGVGASVGPKGVRVGVSSRGNTYIRGGKGGVYFRENLGGTVPNKRSAGGTTAPAALRSPTEWVAGLNAILITDAEAAERVAQATNALTGAIGDDRNLAGQCSGFVEALHMNALSQREVGLALQRRLNPRRKRGWNELAEALRRMVAAGEYLGDAVARLASDVIPYATSHGILEVRSRVNELVGAVGKLRGCHEAAMDFFGEKP